MSIVHRLLRAGIFKAYGNLRFGARITPKDPDVHDHSAWDADRPAFRLVHLTKRGRVARVSTREFEIDRSWDVNAKYRPYRQTFLRVGSVWMSFTQKRRGLGLAKALRERQVSR